MNHRNTHASLMDDVYASQRHIYDVTRKYYLLGRDQALRDLKPQPGQTVLEIGCGTGRNLALASKIYPHARLFGLDISEEMLKSARAQLQKSNATRTIVLQQADASDFEPMPLFGVQGFDRILISYAVSMMPTWREAVLQAAQCLNRAGELHVVDFGQQAGLPAWFGTGLRAWLAKFHVEPRADLEAVLNDAASIVCGTVHMRRRYRDYARHGVLRRTDVT
ncbi:MAG: class I SAM-dependent methyltransferase [Ahrensia sp.]